MAEGIDTAKGEDDFMPFRNIFAEWHARDTSRTPRSRNCSKNSPTRKMCIRDRATLEATKGAAEKPSLTGALKDNAGKVKTQPAKSAPAKNEQAR